ncbi:hypothetical protein F2Q69_00030861 [Brassica cretica]|uniref:Uncharacterized protein n=1 Tax=Brassica cretica TaxID=69181 RepID=A0A8S9RUV9_BRACR|nr:hypothetical protein F2Q69_00030861 [Brassica cretica]
MDSGIASLSRAVSWARVFRVCRSLCSAKKQSLDCFWHPQINAVPFGVGNLMLRWAMDYGIASLSGAVARASDSESLFVEPSGVL